MQYEVLRNVAKTVTFRKLVPAGEVGTLIGQITAHAYITGVKIRFAAGESGTLQIKPLVVHPGNITVELLDYATNGDKYVTGDDETVPFDINIEVERKSEIHIEYNNTGPAESFVNVDVEVRYVEIKEPVNVIGPLPGRRF